MNGGQRWNIDKRHFWRYLFFKKNSVCWNGISDKISHLSEDEFTRDGVKPYGKPKLGQM